MDVRLGVAGLLCVALALGHATLGLVWVLPRLREQQLHATPFGPPAMTERMIRVTWHVVTVFALAVGGVLTSLAWGIGADSQTLVLRWFAGMWLAAAVMAFYVVRPRPRRAYRLQIPLLWVVISVLLWRASS